MKIELKLKLLEKDMGGKCSFSAFGCKASFTFKSANPTEAAKIEAFINEVGLEKAKSVVDQSPEIAKVLNDAGHEFPEDNADIAGFINDITPEQGKQIVEVFMKAATPEE